MDYLSILLSSIAVGGGAFFGAYFNKKGENLATQDDLDKLVQQMVAVTEMTKSIEAKISNEMWDRQRRWEMKRDTLFAVARELKAMESAVTKTHSTFTAARDSTNQAQSTRKSEAVDTLNEALDRFDAAQVEAELVCRQGIRQALQMAALLIRRQASEILHGGSAGYLQSLPELVAATSAVTREVRKELGIDESLTIAASQK